MSWDVPSNLQTIQRRKGWNFIWTFNRLSKIYQRNITRAEDDLASNDKEIESLEEELRRIRNMQKKLMKKKEENTCKLKSFEGQKKTLEDQTNSKMALAKKQVEDLCNYSTTQIWSGRQY